MTTASDLNRIALRLNQRSPLNGMGQNLIHKTAAKSRDTTDTFRQRSRFLQAHSKNCISVFGARRGGKSDKREQNLCCSSLTCPLRPDLWNSPATDTVRYGMVPDTGVARRV